jgi:hypothetical protein
MLDASLPTFWGISEVGWVAIGAVVTFLTLVVALALGLGVTGLLFGPCLTVTLTPGLPDFCPVETTNLMGRPVSDQYYCRFRVNNSAASRAIPRWRRWLLNFRRTTAKDVEMRLDALWDVAATQAASLQPFLPVQLSWADRVTSPILRPETEVIVDTIQADVFRYCNLCFVDKAVPGLLEFSAKPIPNRMLGQWPTKKPIGLYEVDVILIAANFGAEFVTFRINFRGGVWPEDGNFDGMFTVEFLRQGKHRPTHPVG